jgi:pimeloyl-ACP methyl ester carboxylesterase
MASFFFPSVEELLNKAEILLHHLPSEAPSRSLGSALRIFFRKVRREKLGKPFEEYPILATAKAIKNPKLTAWEIQYETAREVLKAKVGQAQKILLYVHGIIGDTKSMLPSIQTASASLNGQPRSLQDHYDLVLAFDYDSLNTDIRETARLLGKQLAEIGLELNHGKELHIVAHSMGGLICRWFIEYGEGHQVVQHLVMLGTPNAGSPWAVVQDWAFTALTLGLNQLPSIVWSAKIIAQLLDFLDREATKALDQMQPKSEVLQALLESRDPHVQYTIIAGNRSLARAAFERQQQNSAIQRLLTKLREQVIDTVVDAVFFQDPNDIAVSLGSIKSIPLNRSPQPIFLEPDIACDHLTYFTHPAGLTALASVLLQQPNSSEENS